MADQMQAMTRIFRALIFSIGVRRTMSLKIRRRKFFCRDQVNDDLRTALRLPDFLEPFSMHHSICLFHSALSSPFLRTYNVAPDLMLS